MKKIRVISSITTIVIMALIFFFSSQNGDESSTVSRNFTGILVTKVISVFINDSSKAEITASIIHGIVRKIAHFAIYMSLGISSFAMFYSNLKKTKFKISLYTCLFCGIYASTDEFHQLFVNGRSGSVTDILLDSFGAFIGVLICIMILAIAEIILKRKKG